MCQNDIKGSEKIHSTPEDILKIGCPTLRFAMYGRHLTGYGTRVNVKGKTIELRQLSCHNFYRFGVPTCLVLIHLVMDL